MPSDIEYLMEDLMGSMAMYNIAVNIFTIVTYVLSSIALYSIANRRGIHNAWLAWIPIGNVWIIGSISDQYHQVARKETKNKRKSLLTLNLINMGIGIVLIIMLIVFIFNLGILSMSDYVDDAEIFSKLVAPLIGMVLILLVVAGIGIAAMIIRYMALYDIYRSVNPENSVLFIVLSILFSVTEPFFLFFNRKSDRGMVPQQPQIPQGYAAANGYQDPQAYLNPQGNQNPAEHYDSQNNQDPWNQNP